MHADLPPKIETQIHHKKITQDERVFLMNTVQLRLVESLHDSLEIPNEEIIKIYDALKKNDAIARTRSSSSQGENNMVYFRLLDNTLLCLEKVSTENMERYLINCRYREVTMKDLEELSKYAELYSPLEHDGIFAKDNKSKLADVNWLHAREL